MTKNLKNFEAARKAITTLKAQIDAEFKLDPRFKRGAARGANLLRVLDIMQERYEVVHGRKVPAKVQAKAGAKKTAAKKAAPKKAAKKQAANVVELHPKKAAAAAANRGDVKHSTPKRAAGIRAGIRRK